MLTPGSRLLEGRDLPLLANHSQNTHSGISCVQAVCSLAHAGLVRPEGPINIPGHAVGVGNRVGLELGKLVSPLTEPIEDISTRGFQRLARQLEPFLAGDRAGLKAATVVILEVVDPPRCVRVCIELLVAPAPRMEIAVVDTRIAKRRTGYISISVAFLTHV